MSGVPRRCPSCGGACGRTKRSGCRYVGRESETDVLKRALRDARLLIAGALHLAWGKEDMNDWSLRAMKWEESQQRRAAPGASRQHGRTAMAEVRAKPLEWIETPTKATAIRIREWHDKHMGFFIQFDSEEPESEQYTAYWGEGEPEQFKTLEEAKQWCQAEVDSWIRANSVIVGQ